MDTEDSIFPYIKPENETLPDWRETDLEDSKVDLKTLLQSEKICQLCKQICTNGFTPVKELESDLTCNLNLPEANFSSIEEPVVCWPCVDSLNTHRRFLKNGSDIRDKMSDACKQKDDLFCIKTEEIDIKSEEDEVGSTPGCDDEHRGSQTTQNHQATQETLLSPTDECDTSRCTTSRNYNLQRHQQTHKVEDKSEVKRYNCDTCKFQTNYKHAHTNHMRSHFDLGRYRRRRKRKPKRKPKIISKMQVYKCEKCDYKTKYKPYFEHHEREHEDDSKAQMYDPEGQMYKQHEADSKEQEHKHDMYHQTEHESNSKAQMYDPEMQMYKQHEADSKEQEHKHDTYHQTEHEGDSKVQMYDPEAQMHKQHEADSKEQEHKHNMYHRTEHESDSKAQMYNPEAQMYEQHKVNPRKQKYRCDKCDYITKYKPYFEHHLRQHESGSKEQAYNPEVQMYKCGSCAYETQFERYFAYHQLQHRKDTEGRKYECDWCSYSTKYKSLLEHHFLAHMKDSEVQMYTCKSCAFETRYEKVLGLHTRIKHQGGVLEDVKASISSEMSTACSANEFVPFEIKAVDMDTEDDSFPYVKSEIDTSLDQSETYFMGTDKEHLCTETNISEIDEGSICIKTEQTGEI